MPATLPYVPRVLISRRVEPWLTEAVPELGPFSQWQAITGRPSIALRPVEQTGTLDSGVDTARY